MKVSELWLRDWLNPALSSEALAQKLTMAGLEVDAMTPVAGEFSGVVVARVLRTEPHPEADKLTLCDLSTGTEQVYRVVCGASNVRSGLNVAFAMNGAELPGGFKIKETHLRGELSQGMLCSLSELGMAERSDGIMELAEDAPLGHDLRDYLKLNDLVFDISLTPNRADCFSVLGIARELAALTQTSLSVQSPSPVTSSIEDTQAVQLIAEQACPRYTGRVLRGINPNAQTPVWLTERLRRAGIRAIHPVVDISNYVMLELGQPLHAFDLKKINGPLMVRMSDKDESLTLLDGSEICLTGQELVISDTQAILALAGVMGGLDSAVDAETQDIFLESAYFNPEVIAGTARRFGLSSDAAMRFERGVDFELSYRALERATALIIEICGGQAAPILRCEVAQYLPKNQNIAFDPRLVKRLSGLTIEADEMRSMLEALGLTVHVDDDLWHVSIPSYRFDLRIGPDLVEEIIRLYGYDNIQTAELIAPVTVGRMNPRDAVMREFSLFFAGRAYHETISYSFVDPELQAALFPEASGFELLNPLSQDLAEMRVSLWPGLLASCIRNVHRQQTAISLFETGVVFEFHEGILQEKAKIAALLCGERDTFSWEASKRAYDFYDLKGDVEAFLAQCGIKNLMFSVAEHPALHPGKSAEIRINGMPCGFIGALHPRLAEALDLVDEVILFELDVAVLMQAPAARYQAISKYPQIRRDLSFLVSAELEVGSMLELIWSEQTKGWLQRVEVFDVYRGVGIPEGMKSVAIALILQAKDKTLVDSEINQEIDAIIHVLKQRFNVTLRD